MKSKKSRVGSKKWRKKGHKTLGWLLCAYGDKGFPKWEQNGI